MAYRSRNVRLAAVAGLALFVIQAAAAETLPRFQPEPFWPKALPGNWILGQVAGISTDRQDNIWIIHRPATLLDDEKGAQKDPPETACCTAAPPVLKFDSDGNLLASWGGAGKGHPWIKNEHGIHVDRDGNVWLGGNNEGDQILKFAPDGKFLQQIGKDDGTKGSNSTTRLGRPAHMMTDPDANEVYVADGYGNRRIIVFDSRTGEYKRHWGAGGTKTPHDDKLPAYSPAAAPSPSFHNPVHCVRLSNDGRVEPQTLQNGSVWDLVLSEDPQQRFIFIADGANGQIITLARETGEALTKWGRHGRQPGQFKWVHNIAIDSKGNLFTAEVGFGRRVQKFRRQE
jgi:hypothetical protein